MSFCYINWTALMEGGTAVGTLALAAATFWAIGEPQRIRNQEQRSQRIAATRQLAHIVGMFKIRVEQLADDPNWQTVTLLHGVDVFLSRALSDDIIQALPFDNLTERAYIVIFSSYQLLANAIQVPPVKSQPLAQNLLPQVKEIAAELVAEIERLLQEQPSRIWPWRRVK